MSWLSSLGTGLMNGASSAAAGMNAAGASLSNGMIGGLQNAGMSMGGLLGGEGGAAMGANIGAGIGQGIDAMLNSAPTSGGPRPQGMMTMEQNGPARGQMQQLPQQGTPPDMYTTPLNTNEQQKFNLWKLANAPNDSGEDYDLPGAFLAGVSPNSVGHMTDQFKKPNHPTFSTFSQYAPLRPELAGTWNGDTYVPPGRRYQIGPDGRLYRH